MIRWRVMLAALAAFVLLAGCNRVADPGPPAAHEVPATSAVAFDLEPAPGSDGSQQWIGVYNSAGKTARFRMDFGPSEVVPGKAAGEPAVRSGEGTLFPEAGSDSSVLLMELQKALRAKTVPGAPTTKTSIPFTYRYEGEHLSQVSGGGFSASPPGEWTAMTLIFGDGPRESEILLHLNASTRKAQFSMKDPKYGDLALSELAKAL